MYQKPDQALIDYGSYKWGRLDQLYRGPRPDLSAPYIACLGGAQTFGRYVRSPFPALLESSMARPVANFGTANAGPGFFLRDAAVIEAASGADLCVAQVMSARSLSNRLFKVHVSRNAQIEAVSKALEELFPHVDFETFNYAHNMLNQIADNDPESFLAVEAEMKAAWVARTRSLLQSIQTRRILFWFSERGPDEAPLVATDQPELKYPQFVDQQMIDAVAPLADAVIYCVTSAGMPQSLLRDGEAVLQTPFGMPVSENRYYPSPEMHVEAAKTLLPAIRALLASSETPVAFRGDAISI
ncbi:MAG: DUF6473 family protein [Paracoccaceae bacterium]